MTSLNYYYLQVTLRVRVPTYQFRGETIQPTTSGKDPLKDIGDFLQISIFFTFHKEPYFTQKFPRCSLCTYAPTKADPILNFRI